VFWRKYIGCVIVVGKFLNNTTPATYINILKRTIGATWPDILLSGWGVFEISFYSGFSKTVFFYNLV